MLRAYITAGALALAFHGAALACGHCDEDRIAAVYDHAVVVQAQARQHAVAYFGIEGNLIATVESRKSIEAMLASVDGVIKNSVKVSVESAALAFVFDPKAQQLALLQTSLEKKLVGRKLRLQLLKLVPPTDKTSIANR